MNIGIVPINKPIVVSPKANPGVFFKTDTSIDKVIDDINKRIGANVVKKASLLKKSIDKKEN